MVIGKYIPVFLRCLKYCTFCNGRPGDNKVSCGAKTRPRYIKIRIVKKRILSRSDCISFWVRWGISGEQSVFVLYLVSCSHSVFPEKVDKISALTTLMEFIGFVDAICVLGLRLEDNHALLLHCALSFYEQVTLSQAPVIFIK